MAPSPIPANPILVVKDLSQAAPIVGALAFLTGDAKLYHYDGTAWVSMVVNDLDITENIELQEVCEVAMAQAVYEARDGA